MFAIIEIGGKQYKVCPNDQIKVNKLPEAEGGAVTIKNVLLVADGKDVRIGQPYVGKASVEAEVVKQTKGKKVIVFKYLRRKDSHKKTGHRQALTVLTIKKINA